MSARSMSVLLLPAIALLPAGCLTRWLWQTDDVAPELRTVDVPCAVHAVKEQPPAGGRPAQLLLAFTAADVEGSPLHLRALGGEQPGVLVLNAPRYEGGDWRALPGAERFVPQSFALRVTRGDWFRASAANAGIVFEGTIEPHELWGEIAPEKVRPAWRKLAPMPREPAGWGMLRRCLEGFAAQRWGGLIAGEDGRRWRQVALAFVGPRDEVLGADVVRAVLGDAGIDREVAVPAAERCALLARLEEPWGGEQRLVRIPLPVLMHGADLSLERAGELVRWSRAQVWDAHLAPDAGALAGLPDYPVALAGNAFVYRWSAQLRESRIVASIFKGVLTPITAALDFAFATNGVVVALGELVHELVRSDSIKNTPFSDR
jgi:hypothetical protein